MLFSLTPDANSDVEVLVSPQQGTINYKVKAIRKNSAGLNQAVDVACEINNSEVCKFKTNEN